MVIDVVVLADEMAAPFGGGAVRFLPLVLSGVLSLRITTQVRRLRRDNDEHAAAVEAAEERARALARRLGSAGAQGDEARRQDVLQG